MKLYEIREESQPCSSWHVTKAAALQTLKDVRKEKPDCILCGRIYSGWGHNPEPVVPFEKGRCCESCNTIKVIPTRVAMLGVNKA